MEEGAFANPVNSIFRFSLASKLQPDWTLMLFFAHTHLTVTVTVGLLLIPKVFFFLLSNLRGKPDLSAAIHCKVDQNSDAEEETFNTSSYVLTGVVSPTAGVEVVSQGECGIGNVIDGNH